MKQAFSRTSVLTAAALAVALVITAPADAVPIRFDNPVGPGHFDWSGGLGEVIWLDITSPALNQPGDGGASSLTQVIGPTDSNVGGNGGPSSAMVQLDSDFQFWAMGVDLGTNIPSGLPWGISGMTTFDGFDSPIVEGQETYLGVQFDLGVGIQYGWIGVVRTGTELDAFAWGYETQPGVPIAAGVPEPGTWSLLVLGSAALLRRRSRRIGK